MQRGDAPWGLLGFGCACRAQAPLFNSTPMSYRGKSLFDMGFSIILRSPYDTADGHLQMSYREQRLRLPHTWP